MNYLLRLIQKKGSDATYHTTYKLSNEKKIHEELILEAMKDSKKKAESMAEALGQKVIGLKSATNSKEKVLDKFLNCMKLNDDSDFYDDEELLSAELLSPTTNESEEVEAVWIISGSNES